MKISTILLALILCLATPCALAADAPPEAYGLTLGQDRDSAEQLFVYAGLDPAFRTDSHTEYTGKFTESKGCGAMRLFFSNDTLIRIECFDSFPAVDSDIISYFYSQEYAAAANELGETTDSYDITDNMDSLVIRHNSWMLDEQYMVDLSLTASKDGDSLIISKSVLDVKEYLLLLKDESDSEQ